MQLRCSDILAAQLLPALNTAITVLTKKKVKLAESAGFLLSVLIAGSSLSYICCHGKCLLWDSPSLQDLADHVHF